MADIDEESEASITEVCIHFHEKKKISIFFSLNVCRHNIQTFFRTSFSQKIEKTRQIQILSKFIFMKKINTFFNKFKTQIF